VRKEKMSRRHRRMVAAPAGRGGGGVVQSPEGAVAP